jgi:nitric oxide reductase NorD protein
VSSLPRTTRSPDSVGATVHLAEVRGAMNVLFYGLCGQWAEILADDDIEPGLVAADRHDTMRLPGSCSRFLTEAHNRGWYEVAVAHRAGHYVWNSFDLDIAAVLDRLSVPFEGPADPLVAGHDDQVGNWARFFSMFRRIELVATVFGALEDARIDSRLPDLVPGFAVSLDRVIADELGRRDDIAAMGPRDQALEALQRLSVGYAGTLSLDPAAAGVVDLLQALLPTVRSAQATVVDSAVATALVYSAIDRLPLLSAARPRTVQVGPGTIAAEHLDIPDRFLGQFTPDIDVVWRLEGEERLHSDVRPMTFRDLVGLRFRGINEASTGIKQELLLFQPGRLIVDESSPHDHDHDHDHDHEQIPGRTPEPGPHEHVELGGTYYRERIRPGEKNGGGLYHYPEWDGIARRYRPAWVTLREDVAARGVSARELFGSVAELSATERRVTQELERIADLGRVVVHRVRDGDEIDFDGAVEAMVELQVGNSSDPRPYSRVDRSRRDVAVAIIVDLSSSTAQRVGGSARDGSGAATDATKRILDVELEAVALLLRSLARLGDSVGVYGFSGTGRDDVRVITVKDFREGLGIRTYERLTGLTPIHMTRLAPVIRHVTRKLAAESAETRLLMVITDGRPWDLDYGSEYPGRGVEYAVLDTQAAVEESLERGVEPFVLTVDREGNEYLSEVFAAGGGYEVVGHVEDLRTALVRSYTRVRAGAVSRIPLNGARRRAG